MVRKTKKKPFSNKNVKKYILAIIKQKIFVIKTIKFYLLFLFIGMKILEKFLI